MNRYPPPPINEHRDHVRGSKIFTKLDPKAGYHLIRIERLQKMGNPFPLYACGWLGYLEFSKTLTAYL